MATILAVAMPIARADAPAPPGSHIDIGVYIHGRADVRSYSVVGSGAYGSEIILGVQLARQSRGGSAFMHALRRGQEVLLNDALNIVDAEPGNVRSPLA